MSKKTVFDLAEDIDFGEPNIEGLDQETSPEAYSGFLNFLKNIGKAGIAGVQKFGTALGRTDPRPAEIVQEEFQSQLEKAIPTEEGGFISKGLERGLKEAPSLLSFPGGSLASGLTRTAAGGFAGETAKELGLPEWAQNLAELVPWLTPEKASKIIAKKGEQGLLDFARNKGLTEKQIAPLFQSETKQKVLSKIAQPRGRAQKALKETKRALGGVRRSIANEPEFRNIAPQNIQDTFLTNIEKTFEGIPPKSKQEIIPEFQELLNKGISGKSLMEFWSGINDVGLKKRVVGILKEPVRNALNDISPQLAKDFDMSNQLFTKFYNINSKLKPSVAKDVLSGGEALSLLYSLSHGDLSVAAGIAGLEATRNFASEMLINPRLQGLFRKTFNAMNSRKPVLIYKYINELKDYTKEKYPEINDKLEEISDDEIEKIFG